jgi:hypothetical protein
MTNFNYDPVIKDLFERDRPSATRSGGGSTLEGVISKK